MKLESQVCSLEYAKKLKALGVPQNSVFYYSIPNPEKGRDEQEKLILSNDCNVMLCHRWEDWGDIFDTVSSFTVAELGEMLPEKVAFRNFQKRNGLWSMNWGDLVFEEATEADLRAKMLIYLLENNLITL